MNRKNNSNIPLIPLLKCLLCSYIATAGLLMLLALLLYKLKLSEQIVSIAILIIYVAASFLGGLLAGKCLQTRRFLWGLIVGTAYFLILLVLSFAADLETALFSADAVTTFLLCAAGGTLGGMLS